MRKKVHRGAQPSRNTERLIPCSSDLWVRPKIVIYACLIAEFRSALPAAEIEEKELGGKGEVFREKPVAERGTRRVWNERFGWKPTCRRQSFGANEKGGGAVPAGLRNVTWSTSLKRNS